jgi:ribA/ribD-fused uncharacterized protein
MSDPNPNRTIIRSFRNKHAFLSNFYKSAAWYDRLVYPTAEHAYQAAKCRQIESRRLFQSDFMTPGEAKRRGRHVLLREDWDTIRIGVMKEILVSKFRNPILVTLLRETGDSILVEGNNWGDRFWGVHNGTGENWLGRILMEIRGDLGGVRLEWKQVTLGDWM